MKNKYLSFAQLVFIFSCLAISAQAGIEVLVKADGTVLEKEGTSLNDYETSYEDAAGEIYKMVAVTDFKGGSLVVSYPLTHSKSIYHADFYGKSVETITIGKNEKTLTRLEITGETRLVQQNRDGSTYHAVITDEGIWGDVDNKENKVIAANIEFEKVIRDDEPEIWTIQPKCGPHVVYAAFVNGNHIYAATDGGLFKSMGGGKIWMNDTDAAGWSN